MAGIFNKLMGRKPPPQPRAQPRPLPPEPPEQTGGLAEHFTADHRACDQGWAEVERAAQTPEGAGVAFEKFDAHMRRHLGWEEEVIFPAFEEEMGMGPDMGPTAVMREEHIQMRGLLDGMYLAARDGQWERLLDQGDTLLMLIQQHNQKEEGMLYPMADHHLGHRWEELKGRLVG